jgi:PDDEXK-like domain of unknown function (DUF3799)
VAEPEPPDDPGPETPDDGVVVIPPEWIVTRPGRYDGMPNAVYHADPVPEGSLSSTGAKKLLPPSCPALFRYRPDKTSRRFDLGSAAHSMVLGAGDPLHVIDAPDWKKKAPREEAAQAAAAGRIPVLAAQHDRIKAMAAAIVNHATARQLLAPGSGMAEQSVFWHQPEYGLWRRARIDWLPWGANGLVILPDYKTAASASPEAFSRAAANYGYHQQGAWYGDAVQFLMPGVEVRYCFVVQEIDPPYLVETYYLHPADLDEGAGRNREAMEIYRDCTASGVWPGYNPNMSIETIRLPRWARASEDWY